MCDCCCVMSINTYVYTYTWDTYVYIRAERIYSLAPTLSHTSTITNPHMHTHTLQSYVSHYGIRLRAIHMYIYIYIISNVQCTPLHISSATLKIYMYLRVVRPAFKPLVIRQLIFCSSYLRIPLLALSLQKSHAQISIQRKRNIKTIPHKSGPVIFSLEHRKKRCVS